MCLAYFHWLGGVMVKVLFLYFDVLIGIGVFFQKLQSLFIVERFGIKTIRVESSGSAKLDITFLKFTQYN